MFLASLSLLNFKNYLQADLRFTSGVNCFVGNNGAGKTNLLDAIHYLCLCKSYFNPVDSQQIREGSDFFMVQGIFKKGGADELVACSLKRNQKKQVRRNKKEYKHLAEHIGLFPVVMISPYDISLILEGSEERRRFLDNALSQTDSAYLSDLIQYNKTLENRNLLLRQMSSDGKWDRDLIEVYDERMGDFGQRIYEKRKRFLLIFKDVFSHIYTSLSGGAELVQLNYNSLLHDCGFMSGLKNSFEKDFVTLRTNFGIHKDDLDFKLHNFPLKKYGSQGQQKSFLIALKLAHYRYLIAQTATKPILLLDDIFDKLDGKRVTALMQLVIQEDYGQIFVTGTHSDRIAGVFKEIGFATEMFEVACGEIKAPLTTPHEWLDVMHDHDE